MTKKLNQNNQNSLVANVWWYVVGFYLRIKRTKIMTGNKLYEEYCNEYPLIMGYREVSYESWLERQVFELRENVVNKNCNIPVVSNSVVKTCTLSFSGYMEPCVKSC